jgi:hypothetical protein
MRMAERGTEMKLGRRLLLVTVLIPLSGCAGSIVGDALTGPEKLAQQDDAYCRSLGVQPGSQPYVQCRLTRDQLREAHHDRGAAMVGAGAALMSQ